MFLSSFHDTDATHTYMNMYKIYIHVSIHKKMYIFTHTTIVFVVISWQRRNTNIHEHIYHIFTHRYEFFCIIYLHTQQLFLSSFHDNDATLSQFHVLNMLCESFVDSMVNMCIFYIWIYVCILYIYMYVYVHV